MDVDRSRLPAVVSIPLVEAPPNQFTINEHCDLTVFTKYLNYTGRVISMGYRNGVVFDIPSREDRLYQNFIVRQEMNISDRLANSVRNKLLNYEGLESPDFKAFKKLFMDAYRDRNHGVMLKFDYSVAVTEINHQGGSVYLTELDIILSTRKDNIPIHPLSLEAASRAPITVQSNSGSNGVTLYIVDNDDTIGTHYTRMFGKIIRVETIKNGLSPEGLYIEYQGLSDSQHGNQTNFREFIAAADMKDIGWLSKTFAEAKNAPDREAEFGYKLKELEIEGKRITAETNLVKADHEKEKLHLEHRNSELQRELDERDRQFRIYEADAQRRISEEEHRSKIEQMKTRDFYEERSIARKDSSELIKYIPALLLGAGAAYAAIKGLFK